jgi:hypothetical protein
MTILVPLFLALATTVLPVSQDASLLCWRTVSNDELVFAYSTSYLRLLPITITIYPAIPNTLDSCPALGRPKDVTCRLPSGILDLTQLTSSTH